MKSRVLPCVTHPQHRVPRPACFSPPQGTWCLKATGLPSRTASVPWSRGDTNLSGQERLGQRPRAHGELGGRRCCCLRTAQTPGAPAFPRGPVQPRQKGRSKAWAPCPEASCREHMVGCAQRLAPHLGELGGLPLCLKGSSAFPHCLLGSQQVLAHFESTFFSSPTEASPNPKI